MAKRLCTIVENNSLKKKEVKRAKGEFQYLLYHEKVVEIGIQKALKIP